MYNLHRVGNWRGGNSIGSAYLIKRQDVDRVGNCWMKGRLRVGDVVLCKQHSGDCFYDYILLEIFGNGVRGLGQVNFGSYTFSTELKWKPTEREFHLLCAGESLTVPAPENHKLYTEVAELMLIPDPMEEFAIQMFTRKDIADMLNQAIDLNEDLDCEKFSEDDKRLTEWICKEVLSHLYDVIAEEPLGDEWDDSMSALGKNIGDILKKLN